MGRNEGSTNASEEAEQTHLHRLGRGCFTGGKAIGTRGTERAYLLENGLDILTSARRHLARSYERGPWKVSAHHLTEGNTPAFGCQPLTHLLSSLGSNTTTDGTLQRQSCIRHTGLPQTTQPTAKSPMAQREGSHVWLCPFRSHFLCLNPSYFLLITYVFFQVYRTHNVN